MNPKAAFLLFLLAITLSHSYRLQQIPYQHHPTTRCYYNNFFYTCQPIYNPPYHHPANGAASTWWLDPTHQFARWSHNNQRETSDLGDPQRETTETPSANLQEQLASPRNHPVVGGRYLCGHQCRVVDAAGDCVWDLPCLMRMRAQKLW